MRSKAKKFKGVEKKSWYGLIFALIPLIGFAFFNVVPAGISFTISFGEMLGYNLGDFKFTGFQNYIQALSDTSNEGFWHALSISLYATLAQFLSLLVAIIIAVCVNRKLKGSGFFSVVYFIPYICSSIAVAFMWQRMFNPEVGVVNEILSKIFGENYANILFGVDTSVSGTKYNWFNSAKTFMPMLILIMSWQAAGYGIVILGASLSAVDRTLYEASSIDGANGFVQFFKITLPQISPTIYFLLTLGIVNGLQTFDIAMIFASGWQANGYGPDNMGQTLMLYIYRQNSLNMPFASAMSWLLFIILVIIQVVNSKVSKRWVYE